MTATLIPEWTFSDRIRKSREMAGLDQREMADRIGVSRRSIVNYERGNTAPSRPVILSLALATGVPLLWLIDGTDPTADPDPTGPSSGDSPHVTSENHLLNGKRNAQVIAIRAMDKAA